MEHDHSNVKDLRDSIAIEDDLSTCADNVLSDAATLYAESVADGSIVGTPLSQDGRSQIASWIREAERRPTVGPVAESVSSHFDRKTSLKGGTPTGGVSNGDVEVDSEEEDDLEFALEALDVGLTAYHAEKYHEAEEMLQEAQKLIAALSTGQRAKCNLHDLYFKLAVCAVHTQDEAVAEATLLTMIQQMSTFECADAADAGHRQCRSGLLLAEVQVRLGKLDVAERSASNVRRSSSRIFDRKHEVYLDSLALLSRISELDGQTSRGKLFMGMIPESQRSTTLKRYRDLQILKGCHPSKIGLPLSAGGLCKSPKLDIKVGTRSGTPKSAHIAQGQKPSSSPPWQCADATSAQPADGNADSSPEQAPGSSGEAIYSATAIVYSDEERREDKAFKAQRPISPPTESPREVSAMAQCYPPQCEQTPEGRARWLKGVLGGAAQDPLGQAIVANDRDAFSTLLPAWRQSFAADEGPTALHFAAALDDLWSVDHLIAAGHPVNVLCKWSDRPRISPLHFAMLLGYDQMVEKLVSAGACPVSTAEVEYDRDPVCFLFQAPRLHNWQKTQTDEWLRGVYRVLQALKRGLFDVNQAVRNGGQVLRGNLVACALFYLSKGVARREREGITACYSTLGLT
ncbi:hypothetical protein LTR85_010855 [Meristemomyces frigidus]|nr:hypothetical protein LTR85_010855 [Meristemomyces frigidus]